MYNDARREERVLERGSAPSHRWAPFLCGELCMRAILRCAAIALVQRTLKLESNATPRWENERHVFGDTVAVSTG